MIVGKTLKWKTLKTLVESPWLTSGIFMNSLNCFITSIMILLLSLSMAVLRSRQASRGILWKTSSKKFCNLSSEKLVLESLLNKIYQKETPAQVPVNTEKSLRTFFSHNTPSYWWCYPKSPEKKENISEAAVRTCSSR